MSLNDLVGRLRSFWNSRWGSAFKLVAGALVLAIVIKSVEWSTLGGLVSRTRPLTVAIIVAAAVGGHVLGAFRFKVLCDPVVELPLWTHLRQYFVSASFSLFLPSLVGGDGVRVVLLSQGGASVTQATTLVLAERLIGVLSLLMVSAIGAVFAPLPVWTKIGLFVVVALAVLSLALARKLGKAFQPKNPSLAVVLDAIRRALAVDRLGRVLVASVVYQGAVVATTALVGWMLSLDVPTATIFALTPLVWFATMLPISLGGLGVREAGFIVIFGWANVAREPALILSLGTYAGLAAVGIVGALWFALERARFSRTEEPRG